MKLIFPVFVDLHIKHLKSIVQMFDDTFFNKQRHDIIEKCFVYLFVQFTCVILKSSHKKEYLISFLLIQV